MMLEKMGYALDICRPPLGQELPQTLCHHKAVVIFGGPMSANDNEEYVRREIDWISVPLKENKPFFGICLGAQMLVKNLGGTVSANSDEFAEIGYYPLFSTDEGKKLLDWPKMIYQWHREGFSLPNDAVLLASGEEYPNQAFSYGKNSFGVQFHSELTLAMMHRWIVRGAHRFALNGAQPAKAHLDGRLQYDAMTQKWLSGFLDLWIGPAEQAG